MRGFGESDKPQEPEAYALPVLCEDLVGLLDALSVERAHIVGHDWGGALGWAMASLLPQRVLRFVTMAVGHPNVLFHETWHGSARDVLVRAAVPVSRVGRRASIAQRLEDVARFRAPSSAGGARRRRSVATRGADRITRHLPGQCASASVPPRPDTASLRAGADLGDMGKLRSLSQRDADGCIGQVCLRAVAL
ncbi:MAG: alpha/beta fold hydrolase [Panacagrimonas sp.]